MNKTNDQNYPCPCCGYLVFKEEPGSYDICPYCFWEDDLSQLRFVTTYGANNVNLIEAQKNYKEFGVCEKKFINDVVKPNRNSIKDPIWRQINLEIDHIEEPIPGKDYGNSYPNDRTVLYYWKSTYWLK